MKCTNCGKEIKEDSKFCDGCGASITTEQVDAKSDFDKGPYTNETQENKIVFILAYLGILFFLPLVVCPNSKIGRFHANQGLILLITAIAGQIVISILGYIPGVWVLTSLISWLWSLAILALAIVGMINASKNEQKPLPVIGKYTILK